MTVHLSKPPAGCHCTGTCLAPRVMGKQVPCPRGGIPGEKAPPAPSDVARRAVEEVLGPEGAGPFPPSSGLTRGGRAEAMPVVYSEDPK